MARVPTAGRKRSDDSEEEETPKKGFEHAAKTRYVEKLIEDARIEKIGRLPTEEEEKKRALRSLALLRAGHLTYAECADLLGVTSNTIGNWLKDPLYEVVQQEFQEDARTDGFVGIGALVPKALSVLNSLMDGANSDFVKLKAVELVLKSAGMETPPPTAPTDDKRGVAQYLEQIRQRATSVNIQVTVNGSTEVSEGGPVVEALPAPVANPDVALDSLEQLILARQQQALASEYDEPLLPGGRLSGSEGEGPSIERH